MKDGKAAENKGVFNGLGNLPGDQLGIKLLKTLRVRIFITFFGEDRQIRFRDRFAVILTGIAIAHQIIFCKGKDDIQCLIALLGKDVGLRRKCIGSLRVKAFIIPKGRIDTHTGVFELAPVDTFDGFGLAT